MRRKQLRWALLAVVLAGLAGVFYQVHSSIQAQKGRELDRSSLEGMLPHAAQWIQNFHRIEVKDGRKTWELNAEEAQYLEEEQRVVVRSPEASFYVKEGERVVVKGEQGEIELAGRELQKVTLRGSVEIHLRGYVVRTDEAAYDRGADQVVARGPVRIVGEQLELDGRDMVVFMKDSRFELLQQVRLTLLPRAAGAKESSRPG